MARLARLSDKQMRLFAKEVAWGITHEITPKLQYEGREYFEIDVVFCDCYGREWTAGIGYDHDTMNDPGTHWASPSQETEEQTTVMYVTDHKGNSRVDIASELEEWLN